MKKVHTFIFFLCMLPSICLEAGMMKDTVIVRIAYHATFKIRMEDEKPYGDEQMLEIGKHFSKYYSSKQRIYEQKRDSLKRMLDNKDEFYQLLGDMFVKSPGVSYVIYKDYPKLDQLTFTDGFLGRYLYVYEENKPQIEWRLVEGDTTIIGYPCKKAVGEWHGRIWTAWYTMDLPYDNGPWKLGGLPGVIMNAHESEKIFSFTCTGIMVAAKNEQLLPLEESKYQKCTPMQFQQFQLDYWADQGGFVDRMEGVTVHKAGKEQRNFKPCLMEFYQ